MKKEIKTPRQIIDTIKKQTKPKNWSKNLKDWYVAEIIDLVIYNRQEEREKYIEALIWCSGSEDFQIGGKARKGWEKICLPLLTNPIKKQSKVGKNK